MLRGETTFSLHNLTTGYHLHRRDKLLSRNLSADLKCGMLTCLLGTNGVGKSTLLRTLAGFQPAMNGEVELFGKPLKEYSPYELARKVGVVLTEKLPIANLKAHELVAMGRLPYTGFWGGLNEDDLRIADKALDMVGMTAFANRRLSTLSDGELQKLMIAKALAQETPVILLDEPVAFLDFPSKVEILGLLRKLAREEQKAVLLSIHDLELALQTADYLWIMEADGKLVQGEPHEMAKQGNLDFFFSTSGLTFSHETLQYSLEKDGSESETKLKTAE